VISVVNPGGDRSLPVEIDADRVARTRFIDVDGLINPLVWHGRLRRWLGPSSRGESAKPPSKPTGQSRFSKLYRELVFLPDRYVGWCLPLLAELRQLQRTWRPDVILASAPPFSTFLAVALFARRSGIPWVAEFRDRWSDDPYALIPDWRRSLDRRLERWAVRSASGIVTVSGPWSEHYARIYRVPVCTAMNGFDPQDFEELEPEHQPGSLPLRIVYTGFVYPERRDPTRLFEALAASGLTPEEVQVCFYGSRSDYLEDRIDRAGVRRFVQVENPVPYAEAIRLQSGADILLLLQWNDPADESNVPGKVFEYLAARRPILGLGPERGIPARLIRERNAGIYTNDTALLAAHLVCWVDEKRRTGCIQALPASTSLGLRRDDQYAHLEAFLGHTVAEERHPAPGSAGLRRTLSSPNFALADAAQLPRPTLCVIVDTEADFDWTGPFSREGYDVRSIAGLGRVQAILDRHGVRPTYLVDYPVATDATAVRLLRELRDEDRCDIGVQLHAWTTPPFDELLCERNSYGSNLPLAMQRAKLERLVAAARASFGTEPRVFKAGRYGLADDGAELLEEFGFLVDTSVLPFTDLREGHGPSFLGVPDRPFWFGRERAMLELPVTRNFTGLLRHLLPGAIHRTADSRFGRRLRLPGVFARLGLLDRLTLTPEGMSLDDMCRLARGLVGDGRRVLTLSFHSPSLAPGNTPYVRSEAELDAFLQRLDRFIAFFHEQLGGQSLTAMELCGDLRPRSMATPAVAAAENAMGPAATRAAGG
jgi:hypothetical protein